MSKTEYSRLLLKRATFPGVTPTIPTGSTISNDWLPTDLLEGELFLNSADDRLWVRTSTGIKEISISGISTGNYYTTSTLISGTTVYFNRTDTPLAYSFDAAQILSAYTSTDIYTTGATLVGTTLVFDRNDALSAYTADLSALAVDLNTFVTGFTYNNANTLTISNNNGTDYSATINTMTGLTVNGILSGTTTIADKVGIGTTSPSYPLEIVGTNSRFYYDPTSAGGRFLLSGNTNIPRYDILIPAYLTKPSTGGSVGMRTWNDVTYPGYGKVGDMFVYAGNEANGLNIINGPGTNTEDYIRFYAGDYADTTTAHIHIQGSGSTEGYVGINTETPTERLDVNGKTKTSQLQVTTSPVNGYVLTSDASGNATWQAPTPTFSGGSGNCITDLYVSNIYGCSPIRVWDTIYNDNLQISGLTFINLDVQSGTNSSSIEVEANRVRIESDSSTFASTFSVETFSPTISGVVDDGTYTSVFNINPTNVIMTSNDGGTQDSQIDTQYNSVQIYSQDTSGNGTIGQINLSDTSVDLNLTDSYTTYQSYSNLTTTGINIGTDDQLGTTTNLDLITGSKIVQTVTTPTNTEEFNLEPLQTYITSLDTSNNDRSNVEMTPTQLKLFNENGATSNRSETTYISTQLTNRVYDDSTLQNVSSIQLENISSDGVTTIDSVSSSNFIQDTVKLDPANGSYLKSQSTTGLTYTELSFNDIKSKLESTDGTISSTIELDPFETNLGSYWLASNGTWTSKLSLDPSESFDQTGLETTDGTNTNMIRVNQGGVTMLASDGVDSIDLSIQPTSATITGGVLEYAADYSGNYTNRSLVDKEYVDNNIGGGGTFTGGTVNGDTIFTAGLTAKTLSFDTTYTGATSVGQMNWDPDFGVPEVGLVGGNVVAKLGESVYAYVKNVDTTTLNKGEVVYIFGASGDKISVKRASASGDTTSSKTLGVVAESIGVNQLGYVITQGTLDGLNLGSYTAGDILWLSTIPGQFTNVKQYAPTHLVFVGVVQRANAGNGQLYVKPQNGYELDELHNVAATGATNGDLLVYSGGTTNLWVNSKTLTGAYTINGNLTVTGNTNISGSTTVTGNIAANTLISTLSSGFEGGEIKLSTAQTGNNLFGGSVTVDINGNRIRFFETGSPNRGAFIDLSTAANNVGTNLLQDKGSFGITIDGGGSAITTGVKGYITIPYNGTITGWDIFGDTSGSIVVDVWKDTYANFPPTVADTIAGSEKPTLSSAIKNQDTNLTTWTTSVTAGDIIAFNVDSATSVTRVNLIIYITKS